MDKSRVCNRLFLNIVLLLCAKGFVRMVKASCPHLHEVSNQGEVFWLIKDTRLGMYPTLCQWSFDPPENHMVFVQFFNLSLVNSRNHCSTLLLINGARLCAMPQQSCKLFSFDAKNPVCNKKAKEREFHSCSKALWDDPFYSIQLKTLQTDPLPDSQSLYFMFRYINCSQVSERKIVEPSTRLPKLMPTTSAAEVTTLEVSTASTMDVTTSSSPSAYFDMYFAAIPIVAVLVLIIIILLVIICKKKCKKKKEEEEVYAYAGRDGISILPDANEGYSYCDPNYEIVSPNYEDVKDLKQESNYEMVDNIIYEKEQNQFSHISNAAYETNLRTVIKKKHYGKRQNMSKIFPTE